MKTSGPAVFAVPFVCGVAAATQLANICNSIVQSELSLALVLLCGALLCSGRDRHWKIAATLLLFCLGIFSFSLRDLCPSLPAATDRLAGREMGRLKERIASSFDSPATRALAQALLSGDRSLLGKEQVQAFRSSGAAHILALSGLHLGIISTLVSGSLAVLGKSRTALFLRSAITVTMALAYTLVCGAGPSLCRALLFISLREVRRNVKGLECSSAELLCVCAAIQLCIDPKAIESISFQLSYLAIAGILLISPVLAGFYPAQEGLFGRIWKLLSTSISAQITTAPLCYIRFGSVPVHFLLANLIALPLVEAFIVCCTICILAPGITPEPIKSLTDLLGKALLQSMQIISEM